MIGIMSAMDCEIEAILHTAEEREEIAAPGSVFIKATLAGKTVVLVKAGVGKVLSAMTAQMLIERFSPKAVIFTGLAGALNPGYEVGDIVLSKDCIQHDMDASGLGFKRGEIPYTSHWEVEADKKLLKIASAYKSTAHQIHSGRILTGDQFICGALNGKHLTDELKGDAVDMEGASVALVCKINHVPFLIMRTISDRANHSAHVDFTKFLPVASENSLGLVKHLLSHL